MAGAGCGCDYIYGADGVDTDVLLLSSLNSQLVHKPECSYYSNDVPVVFALPCIQINIHQRHVMLPSNAQRVVKTNNHTIEEVVVRNRSR
jgi:hypothetical protein